MGPVDRHNLHILFVSSSASGPKLWQPSDCILVLEPTPRSEGRTGRGMGKAMEASELSVQTSSEEQAGGHENRKASTKTAKHKATQPEGPRGKRVARQTWEAIFR